MLGNVQKIKNWEKDFFLRIPSISSSIARNNILCGKVDHMFCKSFSLFFFVFNIVFLLSLFGLQVCVDIIWSNIDEGLIIILLSDDVARIFSACLVFVLQKEDVQTNFFQCYTIFDTWVMWKWRKKNSSELRQVVSG